MENTKRSAALRTLRLSPLYLFRPLLQLQPDFKRGSVRINAEADKAAVFADFQQQALLVLSYPRRRAGCLQSVVVSHSMWSRSLRLWQSRRGQGPHFIVGSMGINEVLALIDTEISRLQQAKALLAGSALSDPPVARRGRPKKQVDGTGATPSTRKKRGRPGAHRGSREAPLGRAEGKAEESVAIAASPQTLQRYFEKRGFPHSLHRRLNSIVKMTARQRGRAGV